MKLVLSMSRLQQISSSSSREADQTKNWSSLPANGSGMALRVSAELARRVSNQKETRLDLAETGGHSYD